MNVKFVIAHNLVYIIKIKKKLTKKDIKMLFLHPIDEFFNV